MVHSEKPIESSQPAHPTAVLVIKVCLIVSVVLGALLTTIAVIAKRDILNTAVSAWVLVSVQWVFYLMIKAKKS